MYKKIMCVIKIFVLITCVGAGFVFFELFTIKQDVLQREENVAVTQKVNGSYVN